MLCTVNIFRTWWKTWRTLPVFPWVKAAGYYRSGNFSQAALFYERGIASHRGHPAENCARIDLAYCLFREKRFELAESQLKLVTTKLPHSREAHLRLARLQLWIGRTLDAAWTIRRAAREIKLDGELLGLLLYAIIQNGGPTFLLREAFEQLSEMSEEDKQHPLLRAAQARLALMKNPQHSKARQCLLQIAEAEKAPAEVVILLAEVLLAEDEVAAARRILRQGLNEQAEHPRVLSLLSETYLKSGPFFQAEYAKQLSTTACQNSGWLSPQEMHTLAEAYFFANDRVAALVVAHKAKQEGSRLLGTYRDAANLERLIDNISANPQP